MASRDAQQQGSRPRAIARPAPPPLPGCCPGRRRGHAQGLHKRIQPRHTPFRVQMRHPGGRPALATRGRHGALGACGAFASPAPPNRRPTAAGAPNAGLRPAKAILQTEQLLKEEACWHLDPPRRGGESPGRTGRRAGARAMRGRAGGRAGRAGAKRRARSDARGWFGGERMCSFGFRCERADAD